MLLFVFRYPEGAYNNALAVYPAYSSCVIRRAEGNGKSIGFSARPHRYGEGTRKRLSNIQRMPLGPAGRKSCEIRVVTCGTKQCIRQVRICARSAGNLQMVHDCFLAVHAASIMGGFQICVE